MNNLKVSIWNGKHYAERNGQVIATIDHVMTPGIPESNSFLVMVPVSANVESMQDRLACLWNGSASFKTFVDAVNYIQGIQS